MFDKILVFSLVASSIHAVSNYLNEFHYLHINLIHQIALLVLWWKSYKSLSILTNSHVIKFIHPLIFSQSWNSIVGSTLIYTMPSTKMILICSPHAEMCQWRVLIPAHFNSLNSIWARGSEICSKNWPKRINFIDWKRLWHTVMVQNLHF